MALVQNDGRRDQNSRHHNKQSQIKQNPMQNDFLDYDNYNPRYQDSLQNPSQRYLRQSQSGMFSPSRSHFQSVAQQVTSPHGPQNDLNSLIKDYQPKPVYDRDNLKYSQTMQNGMSYYRQNFENRNKICNNNSYIRVMGRDNPGTLDMLPVTDKMLQANYLMPDSKRYQYSLIQPEDVPEVKERLAERNPPNYMARSMRKPQVQAPVSSYAYHYSKPVDANGQFNVDVRNTMNAHDVSKIQQMHNENFMAQAPLRKDGITQRRYEDPNEFTRQYEHFEREQQNRPPSQHYDYEPNSHKVYSTLYPEPGIATKRESLLDQHDSRYDQTNLNYNQPHTLGKAQSMANLSENPEFKNYLLSEGFQRVMDKGQHTYEGSVQGKQVRASYGNVLGISRRIDRSVIEKNKEGDDFSKQRKYLDELMNHGQEKQVKTMDPHSHKTPFKEVLYFK